jgi:PAS domain S-box-containing protein
MCPFSLLHVLDAPTTRRSRLWRYSLAMVIAAAAILLRILIDPLMGQQSVVAFFVAIIGAGWFGGVGPALATMALLHVVHGYFFYPYGGLIEPKMSSVVSLIGYYVVGITVGFLSQKRRAALSRAREQQREASRQREHLRTTLACMADGVLVTDVTGQLTLMNPAAVAMTGWNEAEAAGKPWWQVFALRREGGQEDAENPIERVLQERRVVHESMPLVLRSRTGNMLPIAYSAAPVQDPEGPVAGVVVIFRDESERRRTELALRNADRRKDEFLATLAHELRNPLAPISLGLDLLKISADDPQATADVLSMMQRQTQHMVRLIDDLLDVSRITRGKLELRKGPVDLADVVRNAVEATQPLIDGADHQLSIRLPNRSLPMYADGNRLIQVFTNLLNNAAKYTPREGRIELTVEHRGGDVFVSVSDSGIGIPADKTDRVFEMFAQIHETGERGHTGLGIGLTLVKRLVELHGGDVQVQSRGQNLGSTFRVRLPALASPSILANGAPHDDRDSPASSRRRVLVVDDNVDALESLGRLIALMGNDVRQAHDGLEALEVARAFRPEVVLMDLGMPKLSGFEAAQRIRAESWGRDMVLVATTGWGQDEDRRRTTDAGFDRHLVKPITIESLREILAGAGRARPDAALAVPSDSKT